MKIKPGIKDILWMATGAAVLLVGILVVMHFHKDHDPVAQVAFKARRVELVGRMQLDLASAAEAEKSAVLAITDADSQTFADQARSVSAKVEQERRELGELLTAGGTAGERELLAQFTAAFAEFQRVDKDLLALAVKNTNLKASGLAFGPAAAALKEMDAALARLTTEDAKVMRFVDNARVAAWRLLTLLPPHIAEENDSKMDELEVQMAKNDRQVHESLDVLSVLPALAGNPDLKAAATRYAEFSTVKTQILALSRENTNVRSLSISLNQKHKVTRVCQATLAALQEAIQAEPVANAAFGKFATH